MRRYLFYISYIGTQFRGVQRQLPYSLGPDDKTVQGLLEIALDRNLRITGESETSRVFPSSRTDAGVHALRSSLHVDLDIEAAKPKISNINILLTRLNRFFARTSTEIRVHSAQEVPATFSARRSAISRAYLYRLAILKPEVNGQLSAEEDVGDDVFDANDRLRCNVPMSEYRRTHFVLDNKFDYERFHQAAELFKGVKDYRTFMGKPRHQPLDKTTVFDLSLTISPAQSLLGKFDLCNHNFDYYNVVVTSRSFLFRQIRRMVAVLLAVGRHKISLEDVQRMFDEPGLDSWKTEAQMVPAHGLYLLDIKYNPEDLVVKDNNSLVVKKSDSVAETTTDEQVVGAA